VNIMQSTLIGTLCAISAFSLLLTLATHWTVRRALARRPPPGGPAPPISILKPLKGLDDGLEANLESFAAQQYPCFEILLCAEDPDDPALAIARRLKARHPGIAISVLVCDRPIGLNPKVNNLHAMMGRARYPHLLISDSNVRVTPTYLLEMAAELADARVGLVTSMIAGIGERTLGSALENMHLVSFVAGATVGARTILRRACVVGKSMLFHRSDLQAVGGLDSVRNVLAEDYLLGQQFQHAGFKVALSATPVGTVNEQWDVSRFVERHLRWTQMRRHVSIGAFIAELFLNPVLWLSALVIAAGAGAVTESLPRLWLLVGGALGVGLKVGSDAALVRRMRGAPVSLADLAFVPIKDLLIGAIWVIAAFRRTIDWRGNRFRIGAGSVLLPLTSEPEAAEQSARLAA
jgi:ceramide glucosyltransferase